MISEYNAKRYCSEDISLIENYQEASADQTKMWDIHHRAETDEVLTRKELIAQGRYWKRPASELVFLTKSDHKKLHYDAGTSENIRKATVENNSKRVSQFTKSGEFVKEWQSLAEVERQFGFAANNISKCCLGKIKSAYGFIWRHA